MQHQNLTLPGLPTERTTSCSSYILNADKVHAISERLHKFMQEAKPYLKNRYSIRSLAQDLNVHAYQLSAYFSQEKHVRFTDYLNQFRIQYCEALIQKGMVNELNMKGLALVCGFQSRNTLTSAFKKFTGITPSVYTKRIRTYAVV
jgi:AraC-like DNA-binding protein